MTSIRFGHVRLAKKLHSIVCARTQTARHVASRKTSSIYLSECPLQQHLQNQLKSSCQYNQEDYNESVIRSIVCLRYARELNISTATDFDNFFCVDIPILIVAQRAPVLVKRNNCILVTILPVFHTQHPNYNPAGSSLRGCFLQDGRRTIGVHLCHPHMHTKCSGALALTSVLTRTRRKTYSETL